MSDNTAPFTQDYLRKPLPVKGARVTADNLDSIASWTEGTVEVTENRAGKKVTFVRVPVINPQNPRQTTAYVGDWVLCSGTGFKVYTNRAFQKSFDLAPVQSDAPANASVEYLETGDGLAGGPDSDVVLKIEGNITPASVRPRHPATFVS